MIPGIERPMGGFRCILADPPWRYQLYSAKGEGKAPQRHYDCLSTAEIAAMPVEALAATNAILMLWATFPMLPDAQAVLAAWGFRYATGLAWAKQSSTGRCWAYGPGYIVRSTAELLLLGTRGSPAWVKPGTLRNLIVAPTRGHSRKPDEQYAVAETLSPGPFLELFARHRRPGWRSWGRQLEPVA